MDSYNQSDPFLAASEIIHDYDFIAIAERLDESLVVLSLLLDIPLGDVLHLDSKRSEGYDGEGGRGRCFWMVPTNLTAEMQSYLETPQWKAHVLAERALYQAARYSLDLTIERLGRDRVAQRVSLFRPAQRLAQEKCVKRTKFPCSAIGIPRQESETDCLTLDYGCGLDCLDEVAMALGIAE